MRAGGGGRLGEEEAFLKRALEIREARLGATTCMLAYTLGEMGRCVRQAGRLGDAEALFQRALEVTKANLGPDDVALATLKEEMSWCRIMQEPQQLGDMWGEESISENGVFYYNPGKTE